tara:strand:- start:502 stop:834 length:333 start_codon:yes stop_codon:yes gene_type:complete
MMKVRVRFDRHDVNAKEVKKRYMPLEGIYCIGEPIPNYLGGHEHLDIVEASDRTFEDDKKRVTVNPHLFGLGFDVTVRAKRGSALDRDCLRFGDLAHFIETGNPVRTEDA